MIVPENALQNLVYPSRKGSIVADGKSQVKGGK
jgi:hypothetical protein